MRHEGTAATILSRLRDGRRQAHDLADELGLDTSAVRRHLETLRGEGLVDWEDVIAGPGRPKRMYGLTPAGREEFPRDYALLVELLVGKVADAYGPEALRALVADVAKDVARGATAGADAPLAARLDALVALYEKLGFEASLERSADGRVLLVQRNCIFLKTAEAHPDLMCRCFDEGIIRSALGAADVELVDSLALGSPRCVHRITLDAPATRRRGARA